MEGVSKIGFFLKDDIKEWREELSAICCLLVEVVVAEQGIPLATSLGVNFSTSLFYSTSTVDVRKAPLILSSSFMAFYFH